MKRISCLLLVLIAGYARAQHVPSETLWSRPGAFSGAAIAHVAGPELLPVRADLPTLHAGTARFREETPPDSPIDTLQMSHWENLFWSRHGLFRRTGLFPLHPQHPTDDLRQIAHVRRRMLSFHQALGLTTVAAMTATVIAGQRAYSGHGGEFHETIAPLTIGLYATAATLALLAPPKLIRGRGGLDTIRVHKYLAVLHMAGMILTPLLASDEGSAVRAHQVLGYATLGTFSAAMITVTLFK